MNCQSMLNSALTADKAQHLQDLHVLPGLCETQRHEFGQAACPIMKRLPSQLPNHLVCMTECCRILCAGQP